MRIVLFGGCSKGSAVLNRLLELRQHVVAVFYFDEDKHERVLYQKVQHIAEEKAIPCFKHAAVGRRETTGLLKRLNPDLILVVGWRYVLPAEQYSIPGKGCIVIHDSLLPKYRGFAPLNWAIINGERLTGATMFYMAEDIDCGDIIAQKATQIDVLDDASTLDARITLLYLQLVSENLPLLASGEAARVPQDHTQATFTCKRIPDDGLVDWSRSAYDIYNLIRGLTIPFPGAFTYLRDDLRTEKLYIWRASLDGERRRYVGCVPGRVTEILPGMGVRVLTGDGTLIIEDVQLEDHAVVVKADQIIRSIKTTLASNPVSCCVGTGHR